MEANDRKKNKVDWKENRRDRREDVKDDQEDRRGEKIICSEDVRVETKIAVTEEKI